MQASQIPSKIPLPFANSGTKNAIPTASQIGVTAGAASLTDGFPPLTFTPLVAGGVPPSGADFNGILNMITAVQQWQCAGGIFKYDATFSTSIGGYPKGATLCSTSNDGYWLNLADNNATNPDAVDGSAANWFPVDTYGIAAIAGLTNANVTLTPAQFGKPTITLSGTLTGNVQVIFPPTLQQWTVINNTTGAFAVTCKTAAGTGVTVDQGSRLPIFGDGTNIGAQLYGQTPAQFDASAKLATMAALQRMGLQASGITQLTTTQTLPPSVCGSTIISTPTAGPIVVTLPLSSACPIGARIELWHNHTNQATYQRQGTDLILVNGGVGINSLIMKDGDTLTLENLATGNWIAVGGSAQLPYSSAFGSSLLQNGYQKLPGGLILQWGRATCSASADTTVTYPIAFPTSCMGVVPGTYNATANGNITAYAAAASSTTFLLGTFVSNTTARAAADANWWAFGK